jgi:hypothetical protein
MQELTLRLFCKKGDYATTLVRGQRSHRPRDPRHLGYCTGIVFKVWTIDAPEDDMTTSNTGPDKAIRAIRAAPSEPLRSRPTMATEREMPAS